MSSKCNLDITIRLGITWRSSWIARAIAVMSASGSAPALDQLVVSSIAVDTIVVGSSNSDLPRLTVGTIATPNVARARPRNCRRFIIIYTWLRDFKCFRRSMPSSLQGSLITAYCDLDTKYGIGPKAMSGR